MRMMLSMFARIGLSEGQDGSFFAVCCMSDP